MFTHCFKEDILSKDPALLSSVFEAAADGHTHQLELRDPAGEAPRDHWRLQLEIERMWAIWYPGDPVQELVDSSRTKLLARVSLKDILKDLQKEHPIRDLMVYTRIVLSAAGRCLIKLKPHYIGSATPGKPKFLN